MHHKPLLASDFSARLAYWMLAGFLVLLWFTGGASRADVLGQSFSRFFAWTFLAAFVVVSARLNWRAISPIAVFLGLAVVLVSIQLLPLPPGIWTNLPGRELLVGVAEVSGQAQPWRPLSVSPGATANSLGSLIVPVTALILAANLTREQHWRIGWLFLGLIFAGCILALLQLSGAQFKNPLINNVAGAIAGNFANRNHLALFVAFGCLIAPVLGFGRDRIVRWKAGVAIALVPVFLLVILATGSRTGLVLGAVGLLFGLFAVRSNIVRELKSLPRRTAIALAAGSVLSLVAIVVAAITLGRAAGLERAMNSQLSDDLRSQSLPFVIEAVTRYFPVGSGFGTFDPVYRMIEPDSLLQPQYFNHAHNDWLEVILDGGIAGAALLVAGVGWWLLASWRAWKDGQSRLPIIGSGALLLVMIASIPDYPARTPMIMAVMVIAAVWLHSAGGRKAHAIERQ